MTDYHSRTEISRSMLTVLANSPRKYEARFITKTITDDEESEALTIGTGTHAVTLNDFAELAKIQIIPKEVLTTDGKKHGKKWEEYEAANVGKTLLKQHQFEMCQKLAAAIDKEVGPMLHSLRAQRELEIIWNRDGLDLRCKLDCVLPMPGDLFEPPWHVPHILILDIKTAASVEQWSFWRGVRDRKLWIQDAFYSMAAEHEFQCSAVRFAFVAVEKKEPFEVRMYELPERDRIAAMAATENLLADLKRRIAENDWASPGEGLINCLPSLGEL